MTEITFLQGLFLLFFPFLASVAFTLFIRSMDNKNSFVEKLKSQRDSLQQTSSDIKALESKMHLLVKEMEAVVQEKAEEIYSDMYFKSDEFHTTMKNKSYEIDEIILSLREDSQKKLVAETENLIKDTVEKVNGIFLRLDGFQIQISKNEEIKTKELDNIRAIAENTQDKMNDFQSLINQRADLAARIVEEKLLIYSQKFQSKLKLLFDQSNQALIQSSKEMQKEIDLIKSEVVEAQKEALKKEDEYVNELTNRKIQFQNNFEKLMDGTKQAIDMKLEKHKNSVYEISSQIEKLEMKMEERLDSSMKLILDRVGLYEKKLQDRFENSEAEANLIKDAWFKNFQIELSNFKDDIKKLDDSLSFRKEEILSETKRKVESLYHYVEKIKEEYVTSQDGLINNYESKKTDYLSFANDFQSKISNLDEKLQEKIQLNNSILTEAKNLIESESKKSIYEIQNETTKQKGILESVLSNSELRIFQLDSDWNNRLEAYKVQFEEERFKVLNKINLIQLDGDTLLSKLNVEYNSLKTGLEDVYKNYKDGLADKNDLVLDDITSKSKRLQDELELLVSRSSKSFEQLYDKQESLLTDYSNKLVNSMNERLLNVKKNTEFVLEEVESSSKNLLDKQEEKILKFNAILDERISKEITRLIDKGELQLGSLESKITNYIKETKLNIEEILNNSKEESRLKIDEFHSQTIKSLKDIELNNEEFLNSTRKDFSKSKEDFYKLKSSVEVEMERANDLKSSIYNFLAEESSKLQLQKSKSEKLIVDIQSSFLNLDSLTKKISEMKEKISLLTDVDSKIKFIEEFTSEFDEKFAKLSSVDQKIHFINDTLLVNEKSTSETRKLIEKFQSEFNVMDVRSKDLTKFISSIENKLTLLQSKNQEIKSIEAKFDKIEDLMMDLSTKHKQISTLQNRVETLKDETEEMKTDFEKLIEKADDKYEKLKMYISIADVPVKPKSIKTKEVIQANGNSRKKKSS